MHEESASNSHLRRLRRIFLRDPIFFLTSTVADRRPVLAFEQGHETLVREWKISAEKYGWRVGRYAVMPDHVHFFAAETPRSRPLSLFVGKWKEYASKSLRAGPVPDFQWQEEFFDHVLRTGESYREKCAYVRENPVRAGLVERAEEWPFAGEIEQIEMR